MIEIDPFFNQMYDLGNEAYKVVDKNLNIIFCNKKYLEFNKVNSYKAVVGKRCSGFMCSRSCGLRECSLSRVIIGEEINEAIIEKRISSTETKYYILNAKPFRNRKGDIVGMVECFIDITEMKQTELALKESEAQLKRMNLTKDKLFSIIAHDLRSPFNSILGFSELLIENINDFNSKEIDGFLKNINLSAHSTLSLLDNLLSWAKTQIEEIIIRPEEIILSLLIQDTIDLSNPSASIKGISLNYVQSEVIEIYADVNMVKTVLRNFISNALKFTKSGGVIDVYAIKKGGFVEITVSDNGVGMNEDACKKLFNVSEITTTLGTENEQGSGLGLVLCKEFSEKLGGSIWVESEKGKGSDFKFTLPLGRSR